MTYKREKLGLHFQKAEPYSGKRGYSRPQAAERSLTIDHSHLDRASGRQSVCPGDEQGFGRLRLAASEVSKDEHNFRLALLPACGVRCALPAVPAAAPLLRPAPWTLTC